MRVQPQQSLFFQITSKCVTRTYVCFALVFFNVRIGHVNVVAGQHLAVFVAELTAVVFAQIGGGDGIRRKGKTFQRQPY